MANSDYDKAISNWATSGTGTYRPASATMGSTYQPNNPNPSAYMTPTTEADYFPPAAAGPSQSDMLNSQWSQQDAMLADQTTGLTGKTPTQAQGGGGGAVQHQSATTESPAISQNTVAQSPAAPPAPPVIGGNYAGQDPPATMTRYRVQLVSAQQKKERVIFHVTPSLSESKDVQYKTIDPVHLPGQIFAYTMTSTRSFQVGARFMARSPDEATKVLRDVHLIKTWTMPWFGASSDNPSAGEYKGAPPPVLFLTAYALEGTGVRYNINQVPVIIKNYSMNYPDDVDYMPSTAATGTALVPTFFQMDITLVEVHSPKGYEKFSLQQFKMAQLPEF